ncbi:ACP S-malonyltransferase [Hahella aquimaris]|uniref:ACP S-malonyltransferase n=1 Tax=Hahella sp. HNIBRBA332 TaxID=3015983 RepID=UPI00273B84D0|nr:ACP S-malonyltransferase [Hahella sp. HNIBRBA332]WLQ16391.1 ACP S-malonyltransferase [Hahella sp. HNIBRBA332]
MRTAMDSAKTVFLFPGVGAQQPNMFAEFLIYPEYRECLEEVSEISQVNLHEVIHGERRSDLKQVRIAQLALTATTVAIADILRKHCGLVPDFVMGHSLGQYPALCAAGYLDLATVTKVVSLRSEIVEACARQFDQGEMCWVLHVPAEVVAQEVEKARRDEGVEIYLSAVDAFDQATVSGEMAQIRRFAPRMEALGGLLYPLRIGGPFHSPLMADARAQLESKLDFLPDCATSSQPISRLVCNVSAAEAPAADLRTSILHHLIAPVQWLRSLQYVAQNGVTRYLEISPKAVLSYLNQRANLPIEPVCEPHDLFSFAQEMSAPERRHERFLQRCCYHLYSAKLPPIEDAAALEQLRRIRTEVKEALSTERKETAVIHARTQQWLSIVEDAGARSLAIDRRRLQNLFEAAEQRV